MMLPRFLQYSGYETTDIREFLKDQYIEIVLRKKEGERSHCCRCGQDLSSLNQGYPMRIEEMPIMGYRCYVRFHRRKGYCSDCKKTRSEAVEFVSEQTPHKTTQFAWWIGKLCEIAAVSRVAELTKQDDMSTWRLDFNRMKTMAQHYRIPKATRICVDEVYARKRGQEGEKRDDRFFTVISDLKTRRVIWVSPGRSKEALDEFFLIIGKKACEEIEVVATDQFDGYRASAREYCPNATVVWDKFHIMQKFEERVNEERKTLHSEAMRGSQVKELSRGQYRYIFLKKDCRRTEEERRHMQRVFDANERFFNLELIKERMLSFFNARDEKEGRDIFDEVGSWIMINGFKELYKWHNEIERNWSTVANYFKYRVTNALAEGINNVIKMLKRRAFGYRNMSYFRLKIMQVCGYLNSRYIPDPNFAKTA